MRRRSRETGRQHEEGQKKPEEVEKKKKDHVLEQSVHQGPEIVMSVESTKTAAPLRSHDEW